MSKDAELTLYQIGQDMRQKYVYFLLAAVGACIGFAVTQSKDLMLSVYMVPLGLAVALWALSFYFGCRCLHLRTVTISTNIEIMKVVAGRHSFTGNHPEKMAIGHQVLTADFEQTESKATFAYRWQFRTFALASIAFLAWHVIMMWTRT